VNPDKNRRAQLRRFRKVLRLKQEELAVLAGVSTDTVARYERGEEVSLGTDERISRAIFGMIAKKNPEAVNRAAQPALEWAEKCDRVLSLEPRSEAALKLEKQTGKSLAELKTHAENAAGLLRNVVKGAFSLLK